MNTSPFLSALIVFFGLLSIPSCITEKACEGVSCQPNAYCEDGGCICDLGYEGLDCATVTRDRYVGTYDATINCDLADQLCTVSVTPTGDMVRLISVEFVDCFAHPMEFQGLMFARSFSIQQQTINGLTLEGNGSFDADTLSMSYNFSDSLGVHSACALTGIKQ